MPIYWNSTITIGTNHGNTSEFEESAGTTVAFVSNAESTVDTFCTDGEHSTGAKKQVSLHPEISRKGVSEK